MAGRPSFFRRRYLINKTLQAKYALLIGSVLLTMLVLVEIHTYLTVQSILPNLFSHAIGSKIKSIQIWLLVNGVIYLLVIVGLSIFISHKIAGPIYHLEKAIKEILNSGDSSCRIRLRRSDEFQTLADLINKLLERIPQGFKKE